MYCKMEVLYPETNTNRTKGHKQSAWARSPDFPLLALNPNCCTRAPLSAHTYGSVGNLVWPAEREEKSLCLVYRWVGSVCWHKLKTDNSSLQPHLGVVLKDVMRESSPNGKSFSCIPGCPFMCKNEWLNVRLYVKSQAIVIAWPSFVLEWKIFKD